MHSGLLPTRLGSGISSGTCAHSLKWRQYDPMALLTADCQPVRPPFAADTLHGTKLVARRPTSLILPFVKTCGSTGQWLHPYSLAYSGTMATVRNKAANQVKPQTRGSANDCDPGRAHTVTCVTYDGLAPFEFSVAYEVFGKPGAYLPKPWYRFVVCAPRRGPVKLSSGLSLDIPLGLRAAGTRRYRYCPTNKVS